MKPGKVLIKREDGKLVPQDGAWKSDKKKSGEEDGPKEKSARLEDADGSGGSGGPGLTRQGKGHQNSQANIFNFYNGSRFFNYN